MSLKDKTLFITGASRGIGHATARYFVEQGWRAITCSRDPVPPECARDDRHAHITADLAKTESLDFAIARLHEVLAGRVIKYNPSSPALDYALYLKGVVNFTDDLGMFSFLTRQDLSERDQKAAKESFESFKELVTRFPRKGKSGTPFGAVSRHTVAAMV